MKPVELVGHNRGNVLQTVVAGCCLILVVSGVSFLQTIGGLVLIFLLPGWALLFAIDPGDKLVDRRQRWLWWVATSLGIVIISGLLLNALADLGRTAWVSWLAAWTIVGAGVGWTRIAIHRRAWSSEDLLRRQGRPGGSPETDRTRRTSRTSLVSLGLLLLAGGLCIGALAISQQSVTSSAPNFLELWTLPGGSAHPGEAIVGLRNDSGKDVSVIVRIRIGAEHSAGQTLELSAGQTWTKAYRRQADEHVAVSVSDVNSPSKIMRQVDLAGAS